MTTSLKERFRQVDTVPTPWDATAVRTREPETRVGGRRSARLVLAGAAAAVAMAVAVALGGRPDILPKADASWLTDAAASCVEQYSTVTLAHRSYAFEGVIVDVREPADPDSPDPADQTTAVKFEVDRWFWGGAGSETTRRTYALASSAGELDASIGARLLVSGDEDFIWACGFTRPATDRARTEFQAAATSRAEA